MARTYGFDHFTAHPAAKPASTMPRKKNGRPKRKANSPRSQKNASAAKAPPPRWRIDWPTEQANALMKALLNLPVEAGRWVKRRLLPSRT